MSTPVLHLLAGPNGAGKSTLVERVLQPVTHLPFVNADLIAADKWPDPEVAAAHAYDASSLAARERARLMSQRRSFITETVFSHPSKVNLLREAAALNYLTHLHVVMVPIEVTVGRVAHRVRRGGHDVPEQKVRDRYDRLWGLIAQAALIADETTFYDNEDARHPYRVVATLSRGTPTRASAWPAWTPVVLRSLAP